MATTPEGRAWIVARAQQVVGAHTVEPTRIGIAGRGERRTGAVLVTDSP